MMDGVGNTVGDDSSRDPIHTENSGFKSRLGESGEFLKAIIDGLHGAVVVTDMESRVILSNAEAAKRGFDGGSQIEGWLVALRGGVRAGRRIVTEWNGPNDEVFEVSVADFNPFAGGPGGRIFVIDDITELARLKKQAVRAEKLRALGEMAAGLAHEIRNPLGSMELFTSILRREMEGEEEKVRLLNHISYGIQAVNNVIGNVLLFTKEIKPVKKEFDIKKLVGDILEFTGAVFEKNRVTVKAVLPENAVTMLADEGLVRQLLLNLIRNAVEAMPDGGEFGVRLSPVEIGGSGRVEIVVSDTGSGVPANIREKIFDPFFSSKEGGAGLGLAIASQIAQAHGGYIDLLDSPGDNTKFIISLPRR